MDIWRSTVELFSITNWKNVRLNGLFAEYNESGKIIKEGSYKDDILSDNLTEYLPADKSRQTLYNNELQEVFGPSI